MADTDQISGKVTIETAEAQAALTQIAATLQQTNQMMVNGFKQIQDASQKSNQQVKQDFEKMGAGVTSAIKDMHAGVTSAFTSITTTITRLGEAFIAIGALLAGGKVFKGAVDEYVNMNAEAKKLSVTMGMSIGSSQALLETFKRFGIEGDTVTASMMMMTRQLKTNEQGFNDNGIKTRDASGNLLSMNEIMFNSINRLKVMEEGTNRNMLATMLFGRQVGNIPGFLKMSEEAVESMRKHLADLGITLDDISVAKARAFKEGLHDVELVFDAMKYKVGEELIPVLIKLGKWFSEEGPAMVRGTVTALKAVEMAWISNQFNFEVMRIALTAGFSALFSVVSGFAVGVKETLQGQWEAAQAHYEAGLNKAVLATRKAAADIKSLAFTTQWKIEVLMSPSGGKYGPGGYGSEGEGTGEEPAKKGGAAFVGKEGKGGGGEPSILQEWQNQLDQLKLADKAFQDQTLEMEKTFWAAKLATGKTATKEEEDDLKAAEKAAQTERLKREQEFWKEKLTLCDAGSKEYLAVEHKVTALEGQINKERVQGEIDTIKAKMAANQASIKDHEAMLEQETRLDKIDLEMKRENINYLGKISKLSKTEELKEYRALLIQEQALDLQRAEQRAELNKGDEVKYREHQQKLTLLKKQQGLDLQKIDNQIAIAEQGTWGKIFDSVGSSFQNLISGLVQGTQTFASLMLGFLQSIGQALLSMFTEMGLQWVKTMIFGQAATVASNVAAITSDAAVAGAAAYASICAIPIIGPFLAPEVAAASYAATMAFAPMASAAGGWWEVPQSTMTALHPKEMVIPPAEASGLRSMIEGGGGGGGHITIHGPLMTANIGHRMTQSEWHAEAGKMIKAINRQLARFGKNPLGPSYA